MINLIFTMNGPRLTTEQASAFSELAQWVVLNEREGRLLVDGVGKPEHVAGVMAALTQMGRAPVAIGAWNDDGTKVEGYTLSVGAWCVAAPDVIDATDPQKLVVSRPVSFKEIHRWAGWEPKELA